MLVGAQLHFAAVLAPADLLLQRSFNPMPHFSVFWRAADCNGSVARIGFAVEGNG